MAGLLSDIVGMIDRAKQSAKANVGLLVSDPREYMASLNDQARAFNQASNLATQAKLNEMRGLLVTPEQAAAKEYVDRVNQDLAMGFAGTTSVGKPIYYHGTNRNFPNFANRLTYFTQDPMQASSYAGTTGANVRPVNLDIKNTYTGGDIDKILETVKKSDDYYPFTLSKVKQFLENRSPAAFELKSVQKALKKLGYDSFSEIEGGVEQIGVFSPKSAKSIYEK
jgi:hypothetical protein